MAPFESSGSDTRRKALTWFGAAVTALAFAVGPPGAQAEPEPTRGPPGPQLLKRAAPVVPAGPAVAKALFSLKPERGFLDDPFAIDVDAGRVAVLRTDSASFAVVHLIGLQSGRTENLVLLGDPQTLFERVIFANASSALVVVQRDPTSGKRTAQFYGADGKPAGMVGPASDFGVTDRNGVRLLIAWDRSTNTAGDTVHTIVPYKLDGLARAGKTISIAASKTGELRKAPLRAMGWLDGYTRLIGQKPGAFDKATDVKAPDRAAIFDLFDGKLSWESDIADLFGWAATNVLRGKKPQRSSFLILSEDQSRLSLLDRVGRYVDATLPLPFAVYDVRSLQEQEDASTGTLIFSLSVDPLNPEALARGKKDTAYLDLFAARPSSTPTGRAEVSHLLRTPQDDRPLLWQYQAPYLAVLRKHQSFSRGGNEIEVFQLSSAANSVSAPANK